MLSALSPKMPVSESTKQAVDGGGGVDWCCASSCGLYFRNKGQEPLTLGRDFLFSDAKLTLAIKLAFNCTKTRVETFKLKSNRPDIPGEIPSVIFCLVCLFCFFLTEEILIVRAEADKETSDEPGRHTVDHTQMHTQTSVPVIPPPVRRSWNKKKKKKPLRRAEVCCESSRSKLDFFSPTEGEDHSRLFYALPDSWQWARHLLSVTFWRRATGLTKQAQISQFNIGTTFGDIWGLCGSTGRISVTKKVCHSLGNVGKCREGIF